MKETSTLICKQAWFLDNRNGGTLDQAMGRRLIRLIVLAVVIAGYSFAESHSSAVATYVLPSGVQAIAYIDVNHHVDQVFFQGGQWNTNDLTAISNTPVAIVGSAIATYVLPNAVQAIAYIDNNRHIDQLFFQANQWRWNDLTATTGGPLPAAGTALATYVLPNGVQAIAYTDLNSHIDQIFYQGGQWLWNDLTAFTSAPLAVVQSTLATYVLPNAVQAVGYVDSASHVDQVFFQGGGWNINDLTATTGAPLAASNTGLATYVLPNAVQAIAFLDPKQHVDQVFFQASQWLCNDLTAITNAPLASSGSYLATYVLPTGVQAIAYLDTSQNVDQIFYQGGQWNVNDLTPLANAPVAMQGSSLATYVLPNGVQAIVFLDGNHHLDQIFYQGGQWLFNDLTAIAHAPTPTGNHTLAPQGPEKEYIYFRNQPIAIENQ